MVVSSYGEFLRFFCYPLIGFIFILEFVLNSFSTMQVLIRPFEDSEDQHFPLQCEGDAAT
jgi:hypothetical protein